MREIVRDAFHPGIHACEVGGCPPSVREAYAHLLFKRARGLFLERAEVEVQELLVRTACRSGPNCNDSAAFVAIDLKDGMQKSEKGYLQDTQNLFHRVEDEGLVVHRDLQDGMTVPGCLDAHANFTVCTSLHERKRLSEILDDLGRRVIGKVRQRSAKVKRRSQVHQEGPLGLSGGHLLDRVLNGRDSLSTLVNTRALVYRHTFLGHLRVPFWSFSSQKTSVVMAPKSHPAKCLPLLDVAWQPVFSQLAPQNDEGDQIVKCVHNDRYKEVVGYEKEPPQENPEDRGEHSVERCNPM